VPFYYCGAKHALARRYPPPAHATIIEPFAGAAGYACYWATPQHRVLLFDRDPEIVALWHRLQAMDPRELAAMECPPIGARCHDPLINLAQTGNAIRPGWERWRNAKVTARQSLIWPTMRLRILRMLPTIRHWTVTCGDYTDAPDLRATWFIDQPYHRQQRRGRGDGYAHGADAIDYDALGQWCRARQGQAIVCEQRGAEWLPFRPLAVALATSPGPRRERVEVVWSRTPGTMLRTGRSDIERTEARHRKRRR